MLKFCERVSKNIDDLTVKLAKLSIWIILVLIVVMFSCLILKNVFGITPHVFLNFNFYALGLIMLAGCGNVILTDKHPRKIIVYKKLNEKKQAIINLFSALFLIIPTSMIIFGLSWNYFIEEWQVQNNIFLWESITDPTFVRTVSLILFMSIITIFTQLTALAAISNACKSIKILRHKSPHILVHPENQIGER